MSSFMKMILLIFFFHGFHAFAAAQDKFPKITIGKVTKAAFKGQIIEPYQFIYLRTSTRLLAGVAYKSKDKFGYRFEWNYSEIGKKSFNFEWQSEELGNTLMEFSKPFFDTYPVLQKESVPDVKAMLQGSLSSRISLFNILVVGFDSENTDLSLDQSYALFSGFWQTGTGSFKSKFVNLILEGSKDRLSSITLDVKNEKGFQNTTRYNITTPFGPKSLSCNANCTSVVSGPNGNIISKAEVELSISRYGYDDTEADRMISKILSYIPKDRIVLSSSPIALAWDGKDVAITTDPEAIEMAKNIRSSNFPNYKLYVFGSLALILSAVAFFYLRKRRSVAVIFLLFLAGGSAKANETFAGPYCGVYGVFSAAHQFGKTVPFESLLKPEFVSTSEGSSIADLARACEFVGLKSFAYSKMPVSQLRAVQGPVLLHVRSPGGDAGYRHWLLFLGFDGDGHAKIYDPPKTYTKISLPELLSIWDGVGVVILDQTKDSSRFNLPWEWIIFVVPALIIPGVLLSFSSTKRLTIPLSVLLISLISNFVMPNGLFQDRPARENLYATFYPKYADVIDHDEFVEWRSKPDTVVLDARPYSAYMMGHIAGAKNFPITAGYAQVRDAVSRYSKDTAIIFYCNSDKCGWGDAVATHFVSRGYTNVKVYRPGLAKWQELNLPTESGLKQ